MTIEGFDSVIDNRRPVEKKYQLEGVNVSQERVLRLSKQCESILPDVSSKFKGVLTRIASQAGAEYVGNVEKAFKRLEDIKSFNFKNFDKMNVSTIVGLIINGGFDRADVLMDELSKSLWGGMEVPHGFENIASIYFNLAENIELIDKFKLTAMYDLALNIFKSGEELPEELSNPSSFFNTSSVFSNPSVLSIPHISNIADELKVEVPDSLNKAELLNVIDVGVGGSFEDNEIARDSLKALIENSNEIVSKEASNVLQKIIAEMIDHAVVFAAKNSVSLDQVYFEEGKLSLSPNGEKISDLFSEFDKTNAENSLASLCVDDYTGEFIRNDIKAPLSEISQIGVNMSNSAVDLKKSMEFSRMLQNPKINLSEGTVSSGFRVASTAFGKFIDNIVIAQDSLKKIKEDLYKKANNPPSELDNLSPHLKEAYSARIRKLLYVLEQSEKNPQSPFSYEYLRNARLQQNKIDKLYTERSDNHLKYSAAMMTIIASSVALGMAGALTSRLLMNGLSKLVLNRGLSTLATSTIGVLGMAGGATLGENIGGEIFNTVVDEEYVKVNWDPKNMAQRFALNSAMMGGIIGSAKYIRLRAIRMASNPAGTIASRARGAKLLQGLDRAKRFTSPLSEAITEGGEKTLSNTIKMTGLRFFSETVEELMETLASVSGGPVAGLFASILNSMDGQNIDINLKVASENIGIKAIKTPEGSKLLYSGNTESLKSDLEMSFGKKRMKGVQIIQISDSQIIVKCPDDVSFDLTLNYDENAPESIADKIVTQVKGVEKLPDGSYEIDGDYTTFTLTINKLTEKGFFFEEDGENLIATHPKGDIKIKLSEGLKVKINELRLKMKNALDRLTSNLQNIDTSKIPANAALALTGLVLTGCGGISDVPGLNQFVDFISQNETIIGLLVDIKQPLLYMQDFAGKFIVGGSISTVLGGKFMFDTWGAVTNGQSIKERAKTFKQTLSHIKNTIPVVTGLTNRARLAKTIKLLKKSRKKINPKLLPSLDATIENLETLIKTPLGEIRKNNVESPLKLLKDGLVKSKNTGLSQEEMSEIMRSSITSIESSTGYDDVSSKKFTGEGRPKLSARQRRRKFGTPSSPLGIGRVLGKIGVPFLRGALDSSTGLDPLSVTPKMKEMLEISGKINKNPDQLTENDLYTIEDLAQKAANAETIDLVYYRRLKNIAFIVSVLLATYGVLDYAASDDEDETAVQIYESEGEELQESLKTINEKIEDLVKKLKKLNTSENSKNLKEKIALTKQHLENAKSNKIKIENEIKLNEASLNKARKDEKLKVEKRKQQLQDIVEVKTDSNGLLTPEL